MAATIKFGADVGAYTSALNSASSSTKSFGGTVNKVTLAAGAAFAGLVAQSVRLVAVFDQQARIQQNILGLTDAQRESVEALSKELAIYSGEDSKVWLGGVANLLRYGDTLSEIEGDLFLLAGASNALGVGVDTLTSAVAKQANQWGITTEEILAYGLATTRLTGEGLDQQLATIPNLTLAAQQLGLEYKELVFLQAGVGRQTKSLTRGTEQLKNTMLELGNSGSKVSKFIRERLGTSFEDIIVQTGSFTDALLLVDERLGDSIDDQFTAQAGLAYQALLNEADTIQREVSVGFDIRADSLEQAIANSTGSLQEAFNSLNQAWDVFLLNLTEDNGPLLGAVGQITEILTDEDLQKTFRDLAEALLAVSGPMADLAAVVAGIANVEVPGTDFSAIEAAVIALIAGRVIRFLRPGAAAGAAGAVGAGAGVGAAAGAASRVGVGVGASAASRAALLARGGLTFGAAGLAGSFALEQLTGNSVEDYALGVIREFGDGVADLAPDDSGFFNTFSGVLPDVPSRGEQLLNRMFRYAPTPSDVGGSGGGSPVGAGVGFSPAFEPGGGIPGLPGGFAGLVRGAEADQRSALQRSITSLLTQGLQSLALGGAGFDSEDLRQSYQDARQAETISELKAIQTELQNITGATLDIVDNTDPALADRVDAVFLTSIRSSQPALYGGRSN